MELPMVDFATIANATNNFSPNNQLGRGGFGPVYKVVKQSVIILFCYLSLDSS